MPLSDEENIGFALDRPPIRVAFEPTCSEIESLLMLTKMPNRPGASDWVAAMVQKMTREERDTNEIVMIGLHYAILPDECWSSFPAYLDSLAALPPEALRDRMLDVYDQKNNAPGNGLDRQAALANPENYLRYLGQSFDPIYLNEKVERQAYQYVIDPPALQRLVVDHLRHMWTHYLAEEWESQRPEMKKIARAFQGLDFRGKTFREAAEMVTGQELRGVKWERVFAQAAGLVLVPHPHVGSFLPCDITYSGETLIFFDSERASDLVKPSPELSLAELTVQIDALSDVVRLRILRLIAEKGEMRSQEIMEALGISQSAASRNLAQLSAAGYLIEWRCTSAKCYDLNPDRIVYTLQAIANYLQVGERIDR